MWAAILNEEVVDVGHTVLSPPGRELARPSLARHWRATDTRAVRMILAKSIRRPQSIAPPRMNDDNPRMLLLLLLL